MQKVHQNLLESIKELIKRKNMKMEVVAKDLGISCGELSKVLSGKRKRPMKYLPKLIEILNISISDLVINSNQLEFNKKESKESSFDSESPFSIIYNRYIQLEGTEARLREEELVNLNERIEFWRDMYLNLQEKYINLASKFAQFK